MAISFDGDGRLIIRLFKVIYRLIRAVYRRPSIRGLDKIEDHSPAIFVANHLGSYGPIALMTFLPFQLYPWVTHEVTEFKNCAAYVEKDFIYKELGLKPPLSSMLSSFISRICVALMHQLKAIPVYKRIPERLKSIAVSAEYLSCGRNLLIFPEIQEWELNDLICKFDSGFINIARLHFEKRGEIVSFYPVAVNRSRRSILLGEGIKFDPSNVFIREKRRIVHELEERITEMI